MAGYPATVARIRGPRRPGRDGGDPLRPATPRSRSPLADGGDPLRPATPRSRSPLADGGDPLRPATPRSRSPLGPGLLQLLSHVDDLRRLRLGRVDLGRDVLRDEPPDLAVDAGQDPQHLAADRLRRHVDGDVGGPRFGDVDDQQQRFGRARRRAQLDVPGHHKSLLVEPQVDQKVDRERNVDDERDAVAESPSDPGVLNLDVGADFGDPTRPLRYRLHGELAAGDVGERVCDPLGGDGHLEEPAAKLFVGDIIVVRHRLIPSHVTCRNGR
ncbi:amidotransferase [Mycobacterium colombiense CECT 3035]|uniref:Amidotransferase n=1 Tax=Mycobacterium colombiense CECT 3035 TaxID=1041522 RepID=J4JWA8_9MYCO|nr:amidotransferase [Mycobacterium colombiense CECT 3035]